MKTISVFLISILAFVSGCSMTDSQMNAVAYQSGMITAISWISTDNPTDEAKAQIKNIVTVIEEQSKKVKLGESYAAVISPIIEPIIAEKVPAQFSGLVKLGSTALLSGIDLLFAMYPDVATKEDLVVALVHEFCVGAQAGLSLSADSKLLKAVQPSITARELSRGIKK